MLPGNLRLQRNVFTSLHKHERKPDSVSFRSLSPDIISLIFFVNFLGDDVLQSNLLWVPAAMVRVSVGSYGLIEEFCYFYKLFKDIYSECPLLLKLLSLRRSFVWIYFPSTTSHLAFAKETVIHVKMTQILIFKIQIDDDFIFFLIWKQTPWEIPNLGELKEKLQSRKQAGTYDS